MWDIMGRRVKERTPPIHTLKVSGVVIHKDMPCIQRMIVKVRHNTCFKDVLVIDLSIEVASYCNEVKLTII
jgi:hypothetical protein